MKPFDKVNLIAEIFYFAIGKIKIRDRVIDRGNAFQGHTYSVFGYVKNDGIITSISNNLETSVFMNTDIENPSFTQNLGIKGRWS